ncbi:MAG: membrane protein insertase YidC [Bacteroidales bacterium]|nr:membrane protein insertase YidC [Bacteroidales bacterium]
MDKNTLYGLLMMGLVIFGFMYINNKDQQKLQQQLQEQAEKQQEQEALAAERSLTVDSIRPDELAGIASVLRQAGTPVDGTDSVAVMRYRTSTVDLTVRGEHISGTVNAGDTVLPYADVAESRFGGDLSIQNRIAAVENLRSALTDADRYRGFARHLHGEEQTVTLANDVLSLEVTNHGGNIAGATLMKYDTYVNKNPETGLIDTAKVAVCQPDYSGYNFILTSATRRFDTSTFYFTPEQVNDSTLLMKLDLGGGAYWGLRYTLPAGSYVVRMDVVQNNMDRVIPPSVATVEMLWHQKMGRNERGRVFEERNSGIYYKYAGDSPDDLGNNGNHHEMLNQQLRWIAFKNQFFSSVMIPRGNFIGAEVSSTDLKGDPLFVKDLSAKATMNYSSIADNPVSVDIFYGPNLYPLLKHLDKSIAAQEGDTAGEDLQLQNLLPLGWSLFRWINTLIIIPVFTFLSGFIKSYGIIILILTLFIKLVLFPLTYKSYKSQANMRALAPEIKEINDKYPGQENAMIRQQKTMELYTKVGASPFAGCLPMMLQMPILIAMFWFFPSCIELRGQHFLWAQDLAAPDVICTLPFSIPFYGNQVSLFCLLMTATNIIYTRINMQNQPSSSSMPGMKVMMYLMPLMFLFIFNDYAAGLSYYYLLSLLITIAQTYIFRLCTDDEKVHARLMANAAKPRKKSGFMARLEEAQRQQQAMLREQQKRNNNGKGRR